MTPDALDPQTFRLPGWRTKRLEDADIPALQNLCERCSDYTELVTGQPPGPSDAEHLLASRPTGRQPDDKFVTGIFSPVGELIGVLDAVRDYPQQGGWWIGLLLIDPAYRNKSLGEKIYRTFEAWVKQLGAEAIYLGVVERNSKAYRFWQRLGFELLEKRPPVKMGSLEQAVFVMRRSLDAAPGGVISNLRIGIESHDIKPRERDF